MKKIGLIIIAIFFIAHNNYGQDSLVYPYEGKFDYALIENGNIYIPSRPSQFGYSAIIRKKNIDAPSVPIRHYCSHSRSNKHPFAWCKAENNLFSVAFWLTFSGRYWYSDIYYREFETQDSITIARKTKKEIIKEEALYPSPLMDYIHSFRKARYLPNLDEMKAIIDSLSFDIHSFNDNEIKFYLRDPDAFYIWQCELPKEGRIGEWKQLAVYVTPEIDMEYPPRKYSESFNKKKVKYNSIKDSLFMDGHFKVIIQNENTFVINRNHGNIYLVAKKKIIRIGKVDVENNYPKLGGKALFIEDRDNNQIIFFAKVEWVKNKYPKPKVKIMDKEEMNEKFKYVLE